MIDRIIFVVNNLFQIYFWLILVRCLLSFVPSIDWYRQPFEFVREITDYYQNDSLIEWRMIGSLSYIYINESYY